MVRSIMMGYVSDEHPGYPIVCYNHDPGITMLSKLKYLIMNKIKKFSSYNIIFKSHTNVINKCLYDHVMDIYKQTN